MPVEVTVALIAATVSLVGSIATLIIGIRTIRVEREKLQSDRERLKIEIAKLEVETEKLRAESDDVRRLRLETERANIEIEKQKALSLNERRRDIYPEILELVYRLRNQMRESMDSVKGKEIDIVNAPNLGEELYLLTDGLFKYRAFIDNPTFDILHKYKRLLQDAQVLFNRMNRPLLADRPASIEDYRAREAKQQSEFHARFQESIERLNQICQEVDELYLKITKSIQNHIEAVLTRTPTT